MPGSVTSTEAQGAPVIPASADFAVVVVGAMTLNPLGDGPGPVSPAYSVPAALATDWGLGDAVDCATQAIVVTPGNPAPPPVCLCQTPATTPGVRGGTLTTSGVTGTAVITKTTSTEPVGTYQPVCEVVDDGNEGEGGVVGSAGIILRFSPDAGRSWLPSVALGTALTIKMQIAAQDTGVQYDIAPATTNAAYVALVVELRADLLAHHANAVAHDGADTNAGQVALAASSAPTTVAEATTVVNLCRTAYELHRVNITSVHDGPDIVNALTVETATNTQTGIDLANHIKAKLNLHEAASLSNSAAGLLGATATVAAPVTVLAAALLSGGVAALLLNPRRLTFTTAGGTAADAPASVTIVGTDYADAAQTESALALSQTAATVTSAKAFKTITSIASLTADGTDATIAIGYSNGVHNSADVTNTIAADDATYGTLFTGDTWSESKTTPPMFATADLYAAGPPATGAFASIAASSTAFAIIAISEPIATADFATLSAGLNYLATFGKYPALLVRFRDQAAGETDAQFVTAFRVFAAANHDDRISIWAGNGWLTDAYRSFRYFRSGLPALLARMQSCATIPGKLGERMAQSPGYVARGPLENFSLVDDDGNPISLAHDEAVTSGIDGPVNSTGGGITAYYQKRPEIRGTYVSEMPVLHPATSKILTWMDRRVANGIKTICESIAWLEIQGADIFDPITFELDQDIRDALASKMAGAIKARYPLEFQNPEDPNLVTINPTVSVNGSKVTISGVVRWRPYGYTDVINLTFDGAR
jgi:hypothetical protein